MQHFCKLIKTFLKIYFKNPKSLYLLINTIFSIAKSIVKPKISTIKLKYKKPAKINSTNI